MTNNLQDALNIVNNSLADFANTNDFWVNFQLAFGKDYNKSIAQSIKLQLAAKTFTPPVLRLQQRIF